MRSTLSFAVIVLPLSMAACSKDGGEGGVDPSRPGANGPGAAAAATMGEVELLLVDAPNDEVKGIVVTIAKVEAHVVGGGGWVSLLAQPRTIDLLSLQGGSFASLGVTPFPAGRVTQLRLELDPDGPHHVVTRNNREHPLEVPSGAESGIKINAGFDWPACAIGTMTIDFDGMQSLFVHPTGSDAGDADGGWKLRPVIHLKAVEHHGFRCPGDGGAPSAGADGGDGKGNGRGNGKGNGKGNAGGGKPEEPARERPDAGGMGQACAGVSCPTGAQFCLNGTCHAVTSP